MSNVPRPPKRIHRKRRPSERDAQNSNPLVLYLAVAGGIGVIVTVGVLLAVLTNRNTDVPLSAPIPQTQDSDAQTEPEPHLASTDDTSALAPDFENTLGLSEESFIKRFSKADVGFEFGQGPPVDGNSSTLGTSFEKDARANLIGDVDDLYSITVTQGFKNAGPDAELIDTALFQALFEVTSPDWDQGYEVFQDSLKEATAKGGTVLSHNETTYVVRWVSPLLMVGVYEDSEGRKVAEAMGIAGGE